MPSDVHDQVKQIMLDHRGASNAISAREIDEELDLDNVGSFPNTRSVLRDLIKDEKMPIASIPGSEGGYFIVENEAELESYISSLDSRILKIADRKSYITQAAEEWQDEIDFSDDSDLL